MQTSFHITCRKIIAGLLLGLLLFIHAEKIFHSHQQAADAVQQKGIVVHAVNTNCPICDFQLAKDAELPVASVSHAVLLTRTKQPAIAISHYRFLSAYQLAGRGPPAA